MLQTLGPLYRGFNTFARGAHAGYRGQIGRGSAIPHALANNVVFQEGDVLVTGASAAMWGYLSELERTMVIGEPTDEQRRLFDHMVALQDIAFDAIKPGARCSDVDKAVRAYFDEHEDVGIGADARGPGMLIIDKQPEVWRVRQILDDPAGDRDWAISAEVDLAASDEEGAAVVWVTAVEPLGGL